MKVGTKILQDTRRAKSGDTYPVKLRVTFRGKQAYFTTPYDLTKAEYEMVDTGRTKDNSEIDAKYKKIKLKLSSLETKAITIIEKLGDGFNFKVFEDLFEPPKGHNNNMFALLERTAKVLRAEDRISTAVSYEATLTSLKKFYVKKELSLNLMDASFFNKYEKWMYDQKKSPTTVGMYARNIRAIFNDAINNKKIIHRELYPFGKAKDGKYTIPTGKNVKKALTRDKLSLLFNYDAPTKNQQKALDFWLLVYLGNGMNIKDIALLKRKNIDGKKIRFERAKTSRANKDKPVTIKFHITERIEDIIKTWGNTSGDMDSYLFPILKPKLTSDQQYKLIQLFVAFVNRNMKTIAKELKLNANVTSYVARHSYGSVLMASGKASIVNIQEGFGHANIKTTQNYLSSIEAEDDTTLADELTSFIPKKEIKENL